MFEDILGFGDQYFVVIVLLLSAGITAHICHGYGTIKAKELFIALILVLLVGTQLYHLIYASVYIPATKFYVYNRALHRSDCLDSGKGGKRPSMEKLPIDNNPCFCLSSIATCTIKATGEIVTSGDCPNDKSAICQLKVNNGTVKPFHSRKRDCNGGQLRYCSRDQPCTPCERSRLLEFNATRCRSCSTDFNGNCNFIPEYGPYCFDTLGSKNVVPCTQCCTDPDPIMPGNGFCY